MEDPTEFALSGMTMTMNRTSEDENADDDALELNGSLVVNLEVSWNRRDGRHRFMSIPWDEDPEFRKFLVWAAAQESEEADLTPAFTNRLIELGLLVAPNEQPATEVPFDYDLPLLLASPPHDTEPADDFGGTPIDGLVASPECWLQTPGQIPEAVAHLMARAPYIRGEDTVLWNRDPGTGIIVPFCMNGDREELARLLVTDGTRADFGDALTRVCTRLATAHAATQPDVSAQSIMDVLRRARLLVPPSHASVRKKLWDERVSAARSELASRQFAVLRHILDPVTLALVRAHYRLAVKLGSFRRDHSDDTLRLTRGNEPVVRFFHEQIAALLSRVTPEKLKGSYAMSAFYHPWAVLRKHTDRPQCAWNLSFPLDYQPAVSTADSWPIFFEVDGAPHEVKLGPGDGVLYRGTDLPHWRNAQPDQHSSSMCFFHFVPEDFEGSLD